MSEKRNSPTPAADRHFITTCWSRGVGWRGIVYEGTRIVHETTGFVLEPTARRAAKAWIERQTSAADMAGDQRTRKASRGQ